jgi:hypothetical protein
MEQVSKNFILPEFISKDIWDKYGYNALWFIDNRIIETCQKLRDNLGIPLTINDWYYGGSRHESGLRVDGMKNYSPTSQHTFGRAVDIISKDMTAQEMRQHIYDNKYEYPYIKAIERDVSWLHIDCRSTNSKNFILFDKK